MAYIPPARKAPHDQRRKPFEGFVSPNAEIYNGKSWRNLTKLMAALEPLCRYCLQKGLTVASEVTDHIIAIEDGGSVYDRRNLQRLCTSCHNQKSADERHARYLLAKQSDQL